MSHKKTKLTSGNFRALTVWAEKAEHKNALARDRRRTEKLKAAGIVIVATALRTVK